MTFICASEVESVTVFAGPMIFLPGDPFFIGPFLPGGNRFHHVFFC